MSRLAPLAAFALCLATAPVALAHESRPAYLELRELSAGRFDVLWRTPTLSGMRFPVLLQLPEGTREVTPPSERQLADSTVERRVVELPAGGRIRFVGLEATITDVLVRAQRLDGSSSTQLVRGSQPWFELAARSGAWAALLAYVTHGIEHILFGADHLLFVFGLMLLVKTRWMLFTAVTAFTLAHSITLAIATLGWAAPPVAPVEVMIALSILLLGPEIVRAWRGEESFATRRPWLLAFAFGLLHGFGFAGALTGIGVPSGELPLALLGFNAGVELGQLAFVAVVLGAGRALRALPLRWPAWLRLAPAYAVGSLGAFWTLERAAAMFGLGR